MDSIDEILTQNYRRKFVYLMAKAMKNINR
jgi:hypothetical protein